MQDKRKKSATRESLSARVKDIEGAFLGMVEHFDRLQDQQFIQHIRLQALVETVVQGLPVTMEGLNKRAEQIGKQLMDEAKASSEVEQDAEPVSESELEGRIAAAADMVEPTYEVSTR